RSLDAPEHELVAGAAVGERDCRVALDRAAHACCVDGVHERVPALPGGLEARLAEARERRRARREPDDDGTRAHAAALVASWRGARSENFAYRLRNASFSVPIGPFRCLARITSARPWSSDCSL